MLELLAKMKKQHLDLLQEELARIQAELMQFNPEKVILFGSVARNEQSLTSDLDLLVILKKDNNEESFIERNARIHKAIKPRAGVDLLVYTPEEFLKMKSNSSLINLALEEGKVLYEEKV